MRCKVVLLVMATLLLAQKLQAGVEGLFPASPPLTGHSQDVKGQRSEKELAPDARDPKWQPSDQHLTAADRSCGRSKESTGKPSVLPKVGASKSPLRAPGFPNVADHVTITTDALVSSFSRLTPYLAYHLHLTDVVKTTTWIYANYTGRDNPEKIRNFIIDAYNTWDTRWVLLGGDSEIVPPRMTYPAVTSGDPWQDTIPCDYYYATVNGTWDDGHHNNIFGEPSDNPDLVPALWVGRAPVTSVQEADNFVTKTIDYLIQTTYRCNVLLAGFDQDDYAHGEATMEYYVTQYINPSSFNITRLYDSQGAGAAARFLSDLNGGEDLCCHIDHGNITQMGVRSRHDLNNPPHYGFVEYQDLHGLTNYDRLNVFMSTACDIGGFDRRLSDGECVMEGLMNAPHAGAIATVTNARLGWFLDEDPQTHLTPLYLERFVKLMTFDHPTLASLADVQEGKRLMIGYCTGTSYPTYYRYAMYSLNLFGEPALPTPFLVATDVAELSSQHAATSLSVAPSVFGHSVSLAFDLGRECPVRIDVHDATGRLVSVLADGRMGTGRHAISWDGRGRDGREVPPGTYVILLNADGKMNFKRVVRYSTTGE
jgi:hypothetical protein